MLREGKRLPYSWLRNPRLIPPLFKPEDKVRIRQGGAARLCYPSHVIQHWLDLTIRRPYTVRTILFYQAPTKYLSGYKIELEEFIGYWFWAYGFINWNFTGWIAPASDLRLINREFLKRGADYPGLLRWPSHIKEDFSGLMERLKKIDFITPGKKVRPIGPAVFPAIVEKDMFVPPLNEHQEYLVKTFLAGDPSKVLLVDLDGAYSINFLRVV